MEVSNLIRRLLLKVDSDDLHWLLLGALSMLVMLLCAVCCDLREVVTARDWQVKCLSTRLDEEQASRLELESRVNTLSGRQPQPLPVIREASPAPKTDSLMDAIWRELTLEVPWHYSSGEVRFGPDGFYSDPTTAYVPREPCGAALAPNGAYICRFPCEASWGWDKPIQ